MELFKRQGRTWVQHFFCANSITVDKSADWGPGNEQVHLEGAWAQINDEGVLTHLVDNDNGAPRGWQKVEGLRHHYEKRDIVAVPIPDVRNLGEVATKDGVMNYDPAKYPDGAMLAYNLTGDNDLDADDPWLIEAVEFNKLYEVRK